MSQTADQPSADQPPGDVPRHRYTPALAHEIELGWQDRWEREGTFHTPNPTGRLSAGFEKVADRPKFFVMDMFPNIEVLDTQPADWDVSKTARLWETYMTKYPQIDAAFFHNDDMALAAANIMKARNRTNILIGGVDAMPPAIQAVSEGRMFATVRNPSCRIHGGAIIAGVAAVTAGEKSGQGIPKHVITDGPVVTKANAAGMQWMEDHFLI